MAIFTITTKIRKNGIYNDNELFFSNSYEEEAYKKINKKDFFEKISKRVLGNIGSLGSGEFGYSKSQHISLLNDTSNGMKEPVKIWANSGYGKGSKFNWYYIEKAELNNVPKILFNSRKIMIDKKGHSITNGKANIFNNLPTIVNKNVTASGDVLFLFPENDNDYELNLIKSMFMTKTVRFLMTITQKDLYVRGFENIPDYTYFMPMLNGNLFTDEFFYSTFNFSNDLITHIENCISTKLDKDN